jgi:hypothetical protein
MSEPPISLPAIGFQVSEGPEFEHLTSYANVRAFNTSQADALGDDRRLGMTLVDSAGQSWRVDAVRRLGPAGPRWLFLLAAVLGQHSYRVEHDLSETGLMTLDDVKRRVIAAIEASPELWRDDEAIAGESGPPVDERTQIEALSSSVRHAVDLAAIIDVLERPDPG